MSNETANIEAANIEEIKPVEIKPHINAIYDLSVGKCVGASKRGRFGRRANGDFIPDMNAPNFLSDIGDLIRDQLQINFRIEDGKIVGVELLNLSSDQKVSHRYNSLLKARELGNQ